MHAVLVIALIAAFLAGRATNTDSADAAAPTLAVRVAKLERQVFGPLGRNERCDIASCVAAAHNTLWNMCAFIVHADPRGNDIVVRGSREGLYASQGRTCKRIYRGG